MTTDNPVFTDQFYIKKFMEIQQQNIVLYKSLLKIKENSKVFELIKLELGEDVFEILKSCPA
jgi:hypothetical protein